MIIDNYGKKYDDYCIVAFGWMPEKLKIKGDELMIYALIYELTFDGERRCDFSDKKIARMCNCSVKSARRILAKLEIKGLIHCKSIVINEEEIYKEYWVTDEFKKHLTEDEIKDCAEIVKKQCKWIYG